MNSSWFRAVNVLRVGRIAAELRGLRRACEAMVELKALELGVPNPLGAGLRRLRDEKVPDVQDVDTPLGDYVEAETRRSAYRESAGREAPFDEDFMGAPLEDARGDAAARGRSVTVYPEDRPGFANAGKQE